MLVTGALLVGAVVVGAVVRLVAVLRGRGSGAAGTAGSGVRGFGGSGSDTIPFAGRSEAGKGAAAPQGAKPSVAARFIQWADTPNAEETEMAITEPGLSSSPNRGLAATAGTMFAIWGVLGFFFTHEDGHRFFGASGGYLWNAFLVNPAVCAVWTLMAALLFINALATVRAARNANLIVGIISLFLGVYGFVLMDTSANIFAANTTDNVFHVVVGVILVLTAIGADKQNLRALRATQTA